MLGLRQSSEAPQHRRPDLEAFITIAHSLTRSLLRDRCVLPDGCVAAHASARARQGLLGDPRYRTMSRQSEMVTSVRMSATIMAQRSAFADQQPHSSKRSTDTAAKDSKRSLLNTFTFIKAVRRSWAMWGLQGVGFHQYWRFNPMQSKLQMDRSPRCGARTRSESPCQSPAMPNGRCRMHGGLSPGAPRGN